MESKTDALSEDHYSAAFELQSAALEWLERWGEDRRCADASDEHEILVFEARPICYLWPLHAELGSRPTPEQRAMLRKWYLLGADEFGITDVIREHDLSPERVILYQQLARSVSAVRRVLDPLGIRDDELPAAHGLLRGWAARDHAYIARHMRPDDAADPEQYDEARAAFEVLKTKIAELLAARSARTTLLQRIHAAAERVVAEVNPTSQNDHWRTLGDLVAELTAAGEPVSSLELRKALTLVLDRTPPKGVRAALRAALTAPRGTDTPAGDAVPEAGRRWSEVVRDARAIVAGRDLLMVGGQARPDSIRNLEEALDCRIQHECPGPHASLRYLAETVRGVGLVLLLIRFASHSFKPQLTRSCRAANTPLILIPAGYSAEQVAAAIMDQGSERL